MRPSPCPQPGDAWGGAGHRGGFHTRAEPGPPFREPPAEREEEGTTPEGGVDEDTPQLGGGTVPRFRWSADEGKARKQKPLLRRTKSG